MPNPFWEFMGRCPECGGPIYHVSLWRNAAGVEGKIAICHACWQEDMAARPPVPQPNFLARLAGMLNLQSKK